MERTKINRCRKKIGGLSMKINFYTTAVYSDILQTQNELIKKFFPNSKQYIIDGRKGWFSIWYYWLDLIKKVEEADWHIHIDEDCFITSDKEILDLINLMEENNYDISGCPDGHHEYRSGNHMAINSFFMVLNKKCVDTWFNRKSIPQFKEEWIEPYPFIKTNKSHYEYDMEFGSSGKPLNLIWKPETEPYYDFMWVLKESGCRFKYLEPKFGNEFQSTNLLNDTVIHMWHQRDRNNTNIVSSLHTIGNKYRFDSILEYLKNKILK